MAQLRARNAEYARQLAADSTRENLRREIASYLSCNDYKVHEVAAQAGVSTADAEKILAGDMDLSIDQAAALVAHKFGWISFKLEWP